jgi:hypothetical protein
MLFGVASTVQAQTVQVPFLSAIAVLSSGGSGVAFTNDIPTSAGTHFGDGCRPSQATLSSPSSTAIDAYGNIYISDYGNGLIRVMYQGGRALPSMFIAASPAIANVGPVRGHMYALAGSLPSTITTYDERIAEARLLQRRRKRNRS